VRRHSDSLNRNLSSEHHAKGSPFLQCSIVQAKLPFAITLIEYAAVIVQDFTLQVDTLFIQALRTFWHAVQPIWRESILFKTLASPNLPVSSLAKVWPETQEPLQGKSVPTLIFGPFLKALEPWSTVYFQYMLFSPLRLNFSLSRFNLGSSNVMNETVKSSPRVANVIPIVCELVDAVLPNYRQLSTKLNKKSVLSCHNLVDSAALYSPALDVVNCFFQDLPEVLSFFLCHYLRHFGANLAEQGHLSTFPASQPANVFGLHAGRQTRTVLRYIDTSADALPIWRYRPAHKAEDDIQSENILNVPGGSQRTHEIRPAEFFESLISGQELESQMEEMAGAELESSHSRAVRSEDSEDDNEKHSVTPSRSGSLDFLPSPVQQKAAPPEQPAAISSVKALPKQGFSAVMNELVGRKKHNSIVASPLFKSRTARKQLMLPSNAVSSNSSGPSGRRKWGSVMRFVKKRSSRRNFVIRNLVNVPAAGLPQPEQSPVNSSTAAPTVLFISFNVPKLAGAGSRSCEVGSSQRLRLPRTVIRGRFSAYDLQESVAQAVFCHFRLAWGYIAQQEEMYLASFMLEDAVLILTDLRLLRVSISLHNPRRSSLTISISDFCSATEPEPPAEKDLADSRTWSVSQLAEELLQFGRPVREKQTEHPGNGKLSHISAGMASLSEQWSVYHTSTSHVVCQHAPRGHLLIHHKDSSRPSTVCDVSSLSQVKATELATCLSLVLSEQGGLHTKSRKDSQQLLSQGSGPGKAQYNTKRLSITEGKIVGQRRLSAAFPEMQGQARGSTLHDVRKEMQYNLLEIGSFSAHTEEQLHFEVQGSHPAAHIQQMLERQLEHFRREQKLLAQAIHKRQSVPETETDDGTTSRTDQQVIHLVSSPKKAGEKPNVKIVPVSNEKHKLVCFLQRGGTLSISLIEGRDVDLVPHEPSNSQHQHSQGSPHLSSKDRKDGPTTFVGVALIFPANSSSRPAAEKQKRRSKVAFKSHKPQWGDSFDFLFDDEDPASVRVRFRLYSRGALKTKKLLAQTSISLIEILLLANKKNVWLSLAEWGGSFQRQMESAHARCPDLHVHVTINPLSRPFLKGPLEIGLSRLGDFSRQILDCDDTLSELQATVPKSRRTTSFVSHRFLAAAAADLGRSKMAKHQENVLSALQVRLEETEKKIEQAAANLVLAEKNQLPGGAVDGAQQISASQLETSVSAEVEGFPHFFPHASGKESSNNNSGNSENWRKSSSSSSSSSSSNDAGSDGSKGYAEMVNHALHGHCHGEQRRLQDLIGQLQEQNAALQSKLVNSELKQQSANNLITAMREEANQLAGFGTALSNLEAELKESQAANHVLQARNEQLTQELSDARMTYQSSAAQMRELYKQDKAEEQNLLRLQTVDNEKNKLEEKLRIYKRTLAEEKKVSKALERAARQSKYELKVSRRKAKAATAQVKQVQRQADEEAVRLAQEIQGQQAKIADLMKSQANQKAGEVDAKLRMLTAEQAAKLAETKLAQVVAKHGDLTTLQSRCEELETELCEAKQDKLNESEKWQELQRANSALISTTEVLMVMLAREQRNSWQKTAALKEVSVRNSSDNVHVQMQTKVDAETSSDNVTKLADSGADPQLEQLLPYEEF